MHARDKEKVVIRPSISGFIPLGLIPFLIICLWVYVIVDKGLGLEGLAFAVSLFFVDRTMVFFS